MRTGIKHWRVAAGAIRIFEGNVIARKGSIDPTRMAMNIEFRDVTRL